MTGIETRGLDDAQAHPQEVPSEPDTVPVAEWDWPAIHEADAAARARLARCPRCAACGAPMVLGQQVTHYVCAP